MENLVICEDCKLSRELCSCMLRFMCCECNEPMEECLCALRKFGKLCSKKWDETLRKKGLIPHSGRGKCHDCGVKPGKEHIPGCDAEICPYCGGQLISCGCMKEVLHEEFEIIRKEHRKRSGFFCAET